MPEDAIIQEIREIRRQIMAECDNDPEKLFQHYQRLQASLSGSHKIVCGCPKPLSRGAEKD